MFVNLDPNMEEKKNFVLNLEVEIRSLLIISHTSVNVFLIVVLITYPYYIEERFACYRVP